MFAASVLVKNFAKASATPAEIAKFSSASSRKPPNLHKSVFEIKFVNECNNVFEILLVKEKLFQIFFCI